MLSAAREVLSTKARQITEQPNVTPTARRAAYARTTALAFVMAAALAISGCTFVDQNKNNGKAAPPGAVAAPATPAGPTPMDSFRALAPPEGMKFTPLFAIPIKDDEERFRRLEGSVQALRNDFDTVTPTLVRLAAIEKDIRELVGQLQTLTDEGPIAEAAPVAAVTAAPVPPAQVVTSQVTAKPQPQVAATQAKPAPAAPPPAAKTTVTTTTTTATTDTIPRKDIAGGTETASAKPVPAGTTAPSLPVTPEAAPTGKLPPDGAASPSSKPVTGPAPKPPVTYTAPAPATAPKQAALPAEPLQLQPLSPVMAPVKTTVTETVTTKTTATAPVVAPTAAAPAPVLAPAPAPAMPPAVPAATPKIQMGAIIGSVKDIRIGDHIDKTRIVLDVTQKADFKASIDSDGRRLVITLPQYDWKTAKRWDAVSANLVAGYSYADGVLVMDLMAPATLRSQTTLAGEGGQRIVIDLFAPAVHVE